MQGTPSLPPWAPLTSRFPIEAPTLAPQPRKGNTVTRLQAVPGAWPPPQALPPSVSWNKVTGLEAVSYGEGASYLSKSLSGSPTQTL